MGRRPRTGGIHRRNPRSAEYRKSIGCDLLKWKSRDWISKRRHGINEIHFNLSSDAGLNNTSQQAPGRFPPHVFQSQPITSVAQVTDIHILLLNMYNSAYAFTNAMHGKSCPVPLAFSERDITLRSATFSCEVVATLLIQVSCPISSTTTVLLNDNPEPQLSQLQALRHLKVIRHLVKTISSTRNHHGPHSAKFARRKTGKAKLKRPTDCSCL